jgi:hypothetical protein
VVDDMLKMLIFVLQMAAAKHSQAIEWRSQRGNHHRHFEMKGQRTAPALALHIVIAFEIVSPQRNI